MFLRLAKLVCALQWSSECRVSVTPEPSAGRTGRHGQGMAHLESIAHLKGDLHQGFFSKGR